ncbi:recombinase family protein [Haloechinothrix salitolerans]|uniref:Resolvase, N terminal domain n=1 Tax=Haloechinothrix salitolerans TaxID=926830 RepID=A0ABW2BWZ2_9PSEU
MTISNADSNNEIEQKPGTRAVFYLRVASAGQIEHDCEAQWAACLRKAREPGIAFIDEYVEPGTKKDEEAD